MSNTANKILALIMSGMITGLGATTSLESEARLRRGLDCFITRLSGFEPLAQSPSPTILEHMLKQKGVTEDIVRKHILSFCLKSELCTLIAQAEGASSSSPQGGALARIFNLIEESIISSQRTDNDSGVRVHCGDRGPLHIVEVTRGASSKNELRIYFNCALGNQPNRCEGVVSGGFRYRIYPTNIRGKRKSCMELIPDNSNALDKVNQIAARLRALPADETMT
jgi:hypothetical protein